MTDLARSKKGITFFWKSFLLRLIDSRPLASWLGTSWRQIHSPTLFVWGKALQANPRYWPQASIQSGIHGEAIESWRSELAQSDEILSRHDLGAGERLRGCKQVDVALSDIASRASTSRKDAMAMCRWLRCIAPRGRFLELGTSLGITSAHVASIGWDVETWEGCPSTLELARTGWKKLGYQKSIVSKCGDFRDLVRKLDGSTAWDVVYLDGCHEEEATLNLVDKLAPHVQVALVVDDIAWSAGMHRAWLALQDRRQWRVSFSWRGRGFLLKAPHMKQQRFRLT